MKLIGPYKEKNSEYFQQAISLYLSAFPENERCPVNDFINNILTERNKLFIALDDDIFVGFLTFWQFDDFDYIEHFAVMPETRGKGYGSKILSEISRISIQDHKPIVLEVEIPTTPEAVARIGFYTKAGFNVIKKNYTQPPYVCNQQAVDMYLMGNDNKALQEDEVAEIVNKLYQNIYKTSAFSN